MAGFTNNAKICIVTIMLTLGAGTVNAGQGDYISIAAVGDVMMGTTYPEELLPPNDGKGIFSKVKEYLEGNDIVFANLEGPLTEFNEQSKCKEENPNCYIFRTPTRYAAHLKAAGFNAVNIANNHIADFGEDGVNETMHTVGKTGIQATGGDRIAFFVHKGKRVVVTGFSFMKPSQWSYSITDIKKAQSIIKDLKRSNDIVIVSFHGGAEGKSAQHVTGESEEYLGEERGNVMQFSHAVVDAGADLVLGHGPHVLRAIEIYKGKMIAYSLGNFLTYERFNTSGESGISMILNVQLDSVTGDFLSGEIIPVKLVDNGIPVIDNEGQAIKLVKRLTEEDIGFQHIRIAESGLLGEEGVKGKMAAVIKAEKVLPTD